jgi:hypothetical protein
VNIDQIIAGVNAEADRLRALEEQKNPTIANGLRQLSSTELTAKVNGLFAGLGQRSGSNGVSLALPHLQMQAPFVPHSNKRYHANDLLRYHGDEFIRVAYIALLGRAADPTGFQHFQKLLLAGTEKAEILVRMLRSDEAKQRGVLVEGLGFATVRAALSKVPVLGYVTQWLWALLKLPKLVARVSTDEAYNANQQQHIAAHLNSASKR